MRNKSKSKRTEAALSLLVTSALVITLAIAVASAIKKGTNNDENNIVNLNETQSQNLSVDNRSQQKTTEAPIKTPSADMENNRGGSETGLTSDYAETDDIADDSGEKAPQQAGADNAASEDIPVVSPDSVSAGYSFSEADILKMPVSGEIILDYSMDNTIWFPTLGVYKCNPGIYISGDVGTDVTASAPGKVESVTANEELGNMVTIDMGNGYKATYGQLDDIRVSEGEVVLADSVIGTVAEPTIYYTMEGSGIYFKLTHNNVPDNPLDYME